MAMSILLLREKIISRSILPAVGKTSIYCEQNRPKSCFVGAQKQSGVSTLYGLRYVWQNRSRNYFAVSSKMTLQKISRP